MKEKIKITFCVGTACHLMGAADLVTIEDYLDDSLRDKVEVAWVTCMGHCKDASQGKPPFVLIENELISEATMNKVLKRAKELVG